MNILPLNSPLFNLYIFYLPYFTYFKISVLKLIFGPKRDEVTGEWRKLDNDDLNGLYSSPNIILMIKSGIMRWSGHVARMRRRGLRT
jgi:hypothetical protein